MTGVAAHDKENSEGGIKPQPYAPSWVDRFTTLIDRLPGSSWVYYVGIGLILFLVPTGILWGEGIYPVGTFLGAHGFLAGMLVLFPALIHYLDNAMDRALATLRPMLKTDEETYQSLRYRLTTLPWHFTLLASVIAAAIVVALTETLGAPLSISGLVGSPVTPALIYGMYVLAWWVWGAFIYHVIHQLRVINRIYTDHTCINPFRVRPLYAFSSATAITAVSLTIPPYAWLALNQSLRDPIAIGITLPVTALALVAFVWPQLGVRRLLAAEKDQMLDALSQRFEAAIINLRQRADGRDVEGIDDAVKVLEALEIEERVLKGVSTWPWQPETVRYLVTALFLPLVLWLIQFIIERVTTP